MQSWSRVVGSVMVASLLAACGSSGPLGEQKLDAVTGVTVKRSTSPTVLYRDNSAYAAHARDYVYMGPVEINRMGLAVLSDQENCLAFQGLRCEVCYRACPLMGEAISIEFLPQDRTGKHAFFLPVVRSDACTGCGMCEHACPLEEAAIKVMPRRLAMGRLGDNYRIGWKERSTISRDFQPSDGTPEPGAWRDNTDRVLEELEDLSGIEDR